MSYNNVMPAWMLGKFSEVYNNFLHKKITTKEFYEGIKDIPEVPNVVKQTWKEKASGN